MKILDTEKSMDGSSSDLRQLLAEIQARAVRVRDELSGLQTRRASLDEAIQALSQEEAHLRALELHYGVGERRQPAVTEVESRITWADRVVALLQEAGRPMHYREIERELRARGQFEGQGKDPANALLATYFKDPRLDRPARGTYSLRKADGSKVPARRSRK